MSATSFRNSNVYIKILPFDEYDLDNKSIIFLLVT